MAPFWRPSLDRFEDRKLSQNTANQHPHEPSSSTSPPLFSFDDIGGLVPPSHEEITDLALVQDLERGARREATDGDQGANALITLNADHNERSNVAIIIFAIERALNALLRALFILAGNLERLIRDLLRCYDWLVPRAFIRWMSIAMTIVVALFITAIFGSIVFPSIKTWNPIPRD